MASESDKGFPETGGELHAQLKFSDLAMIHPATAGLPSAGERKR